MIRALRVRAQKRVGSPELPVTRPQQREGRSAGSAVCVARGYRHGLGSRVTEPFGKHNVKMGSEMMAELRFSVLDP